MHWRVDARRASRLTATLAVRVAGRKARRPAASHTTRRWEEVPSMGDEHSRSRSRSRCRCRCRSQTQTQTQTQHSTACRRTTPLRVCLLLLLLLASCGSHSQSRAAGSRLHLSLGQSGLTGQPPSPATCSARWMGCLPPPAGPMSLPKPY